MLSKFGVFVGVLASRFAMLALHERLAVVLVTVRQPVVQAVSAIDARASARLLRERGMLFRDWRAQAKFHGRVAGLD